MPEGPFPIKFINPAPWAYKITSLFGDPRDYGSHEGIDLAPTAKKGPYPVVAAAGGKVVDTGYREEDYGYYVVIDHGGGFQTLYAHLETTPNVNKDDKVVAAQVIGLAGNTGNSTGTHLHFSIKKDGKYVNPVDWLSDAAYEVIKDALESAGKPVSSAAATVLQRVGAGDCYRRWFAGELTDAEFDACVSANLTDEERAALLQDATIGGYLKGESGGAVSGLSKAIKELDAEKIKAVPGYYAGEIKQAVETGIVAAVNRDIITPLKNAALNTITWPFRAMINTMQLSGTPLTTGAETVAWLQQPENQKLYIASQAALLIVLILIVLSVAALLREPTKTVVKTAANPVSAAADML